MIFFKLFLIFMFKDANLVENQQIWRNIFLKVELCGVYGVFFSSSLQTSKICLSGTQGLHE